MNDLFHKARLANLPELVITCSNTYVKLNKDFTKGLGDECPSCGPQKSLEMSKRHNQWRFRCALCGIHGDAIDYVQLICGLNPRNAAFKILEMQPELADEEVNLIDKTTQNIAIMEVAKRLMYLGHTSVKEVVEWTKQYGLSEQQIINLALDCRLRMLPVNIVDAMKRLNDWLGKDLMLRSGILKPTNKCPAVAYRQIILASQDKKALEFVSLDDNAHSLLYGELTTPILLAQNEHDKEVALVNGAKDGLKAIGAGYKGTIWDAPNGNWKVTWFTNYVNTNPETQFNLSHLPAVAAAEVAAILQENSIAFV